MTAVFEQPKGKGGAKGRAHLPGEEGIWVFVIGDMLLFGLIFVVFAFYRGQDPALFLAGQQSLNNVYGVTNTLLLLTSSWFVVTGVHAAKNNDGRYAANCLSLAMLCGVGFAVFKFVEYGEKFDAGLVLTTNDFYMFYYVLTGLHFAHVIIGLVVLNYGRLLCARGLKGENPISALESCATYWHMVDLLWIFLFPLVYLLK